jgi:hypothetical protein
MALPRLSNTKMLAIVARSYPLLLPDNTDAATDSLMTIRKLVSTTAIGLAVVLFSKE